MEQIRCGREDPGVPAIIYAGLVCSMIREYAKNQPAEENLDAESLMMRECAKNQPAEENPDAESVAHRSPR